MPIRIYGPSVYPERNAHKSITLWPDAGLVIQKETRKKKKKKKSYPDCSTRLFHNFILLFCFSAFLYFFLSLFFFFLNFVVVAWKSLLKANEKSF